MYFLLRDLFSGIRVKVKYQGHVWKKNGCSRGALVILNTAFVYHFCFPGHDLYKGTPTFQYKYFKWQNNCRSDNELYVHGLVVSYDAFLLDTLCLGDPFTGNVVKYPDTTVTLLLSLFFQAMIYTKALRLSSINISSGSTTVGQIMNHMSMDSAFLMMLFFFIHYAWATPLQVNCMYDACRALAGSQSL